MKYTVKQYAATLLDSVQSNGKAKSDKDQAAVVKKFLTLLQRNGDFARRAQIIKEAERQHFKANGIHKVDVELASETPASLEKDIEGAIGGKIVFRSLMNKEILGGIKILIDDETLIDGSARRQIARLFATKS